MTTSVLRWSGAALVVAQAHFLSGSTQLFKLYYAIDNSEEAIIIFIIKIIINFILYCWRCTAGKVQRHYKWSAKVGRVSSFKVNFAFSLSLSRFVACLCVRVRTSKRSMERQQSNLALSSNDWWLFQPYPRDISGSVFESRENYAIVGLSGLPLVSIRSQ